jgi:hypothetical protein
MVGSIRLLTAVCLFTLSAPLFGQSGTATITGVVTDTTGATMNGVKVIARDPDTGFSRETVTNETGNFNMPGLRPSSYDVTAEIAGFRRYSMKEFRVEVDQTARIDIQMEVGQVTEQIEVKGTAQLLHTENATIGAVIEQRRILELPLNGRNFAALALLVPGVNSGAPGTSTGGGMSIGGARPEQNAFQLDGVTNSDQYDNDIAFRPSIDSIEEFKIEVSNYSAEFGKGGGGQINVITKSGTNQFHGSLYEFNRNDVVQARNLFQRDPNFVNKEGKFIAPPYNRNEFGAAGGGPIKKDRTFFFGYYEGLRNVRGQTGLRTVPNAAVRAGDFSSNLGRQLGTDALGRSVFANQIFDARSSRQVAGSTRFIRDPFPGNKIPLSYFDPVAAKILQTDLWPGPNVPGERDASTGNPRQNYADGRSNRSENDQFMARVDHRFTQNDNVYVRYGYLNTDSFSPGNFVGNERLNPGSKHVVSASYTKAISASKINEVRFGYYLETNESGAKRILEGRNLVKELGIRGLPLAGPGAPDVGITGFTGFGDGGESLRDDKTLQILDMFSFNKGRHFLKVGVEFRKLQADLLSNPSNTRGSFDFDTAEWSGLEGFPGTGNPFATFLLGLPRQKGRRPGDHSTFLRAAEYAAYVQDDFKVSSRLTVNLGVRYQLYIPPKETRNHISSIRINTFPGSFAEGGIFLCKDPQKCAGLNRSLPVLGLGLTLNDLRVDRLPEIVVAGREVPPSLTTVEKTDFGPRVGIAYRLTPKTVIRTGYGLFFDTDPMRNFQDAVENVPFVREDQQSLSAFQSGLPPAEAFIGYVLDDPPIGSFTPGPNTYSVGFRNSYMQQWNFGVQQQLGNTFVVEVGYAGSKGTRLNRRENLNTQEPRSDSAKIASSVHPHLRRLLPYAVFEGKTLVPLDNWFSTTSTAFSNYHALLARLEKRFSNGLTFTNSFTWSKAITDASSFYQTGNNDTGNRIQDIYNKKADKGLAPYDHRLRFVSSFLYELPFGRNRKFGRGAPAIVNHLIGGWQVNGIATFQSGYPITVLRNGDPLGVGTTGVRPDAICNPNLPRGERTLTRFFDTACFVAPPDRFGNASRSTVSGPGNNNWDISIFKNTQITERFRLQFRSEFFNACNHPGWSQPGRNQGGSNFGVVTGASDPRIVQFGLKLLF